MSAWEAAAWDDPADHEAQDGADDDDLDDPDDWARTASVPELRAAVRDGKRAKAELPALEREITFRRAGVPGTPLGRLMFKAYDGSVDVESVRAAWADLQPPARPADDD